jgi:hypothetical protein
MEDWELGGGRVEGFEGMMRMLMGTCVCMCTRGHVGMLASEEARHQSRFDYILFIFPFLHYTQYMLPS